MLKRIRMICKLSCVDFVSRYQGGNYHWNRWQPSRGISGNLVVESVATFVWNTQNLAYTITYDIVSSTVTAWAVKPIRPTGNFQRLLALRLRTKALEKFQHRQSRLKLNSIHRHDR